MRQAPGRPDGNMAGVEIPVVPVRRQIAVTTPIPQLPPDFPFVVDFARNLYFHREGPSILTGMSNLKEPPGFDQHVDREWELVHSMPPWSGCPFSKRWGSAIGGRASMRSVPMPIRSSEGSRKPEGLFLTTGSRVMGSCMARLVDSSWLKRSSMERRTTLDISSLGLTRFRKGKPIVEYNVV